MLLLLAAVSSGQMQQQHEPVGPLPPACRTAGQKIRRIVRILCQLSEMSLVATVPLRGSPGRTGQLGNVSVKALG